MGSEIDLYGGNSGELAPYAPSQPLAPAPDWNTTDVDLLRDTAYTAGGQQILGQPLPPGVSIGEAVEAYRQLSKVFLSDFLQLGHNISRSKKAVEWYMEALTNPPAQQQKRHSYNLFEHSLDPIFQAFANFAHDNGFPAKMVQDMCWWVSEAGKRLSTEQTPGSGVQPRTAPPTSTEAIIDSLSDSDYSMVIKINERAIDRAKDILRQRWGDSYAQNIQVTQSYIDSLPAADQRLFSQFTTGWVQLRYTPDFWLRMFDAAIGAHSIGNSSDIAREIAQFEAMLKVPSERARYMRDPQMQGRLRELYARRGG